MGQRKKERKKERKIQRCKVKKNGGQREKARPKGGQRKRESKNGVLYILLSVWSVQHPNAGQNMHFNIFLLKS